MVLLKPEKRWNNPQCEFEGYPLKVELLEFAKINNTHFSKIATIQDSEEAWHEVVRHTN